MKTAPRVQAVIPLTPLISKAILKENQQMIEVTDEADLEKQLNSNIRVLALFYASWCPFCRSFVSIFNKHGQDPCNMAYIKVKIDEDENPMWETYDLVAVPSLILFDHGQLLKRLDCELGAGLSEQQFTKWLERI